MKKIAWALVLSSALPACSLIQPLDDAKPDSAGGSSQNGKGGNGNGGTDDVTPSGGSVVTPGGGAGGAGTSGGAAPTAGAPSGGAGGKAPTGGTSSGGAGGRAPTGGASSGGAGGSAPVGANCTSPPAAACGGSLLGTWAFDSSCISVPADDTSVPAACQGGLAYQTYSITGTLTFTATTITETFNQDVREALLYSAGCITALHASNSGYPAPPASTATCQQFATNQKTNGATDATCPYDASNGSCACLIDFEGSGTATDDYSITGTGTYEDITDNDSPWTYCVKGSTLTLSEVITGGTSFQYVLTKM